MYLPRGVLTPDRVDYKQKMTLVKMILAAWLPAAAVGTLEVRFPYEKRMREG